MRLVIVGGMAGGMSCAARARRLDENAEIIVLERGADVSFAGCGLPYLVSGEIEDAHKLLVQTPESLRAALNLDVRTRHDVISLDPETQTLTVNTPDGVTTISYDALVLSPGAQVYRPPIPGLDSVRVRELRTVPDAVALRDRVEGGAQRAVVLGGGFIGVEAAEGLAHRGLAVDLVELAPHVLPFLEPEMAALIEDELARIGVTVRTGIGAQAVEPGTDTDTVMLTDGTQLSADAVVLAVGVRPDTKVFETAGVVCERGSIVVDDQAKTNVPNIWAVGDATLSVDAVTGVLRPVALAGPANRAGRVAADQILRPNEARPVPPALGTSVLRVGSLTAAATGATSSALGAAGVEFRSVHLHPNQHAGYFPGAHPVHLVVHFRAGDGSLLGAQAVGRDGVEKRIDVLATAVRAGLSVADLIDLDLCYSPPYGQAKDPVNLAGMIGENVLAGTVRLWQARDLDAVLKDSLILDVRCLTEAAAGQIPGSLVIPHTQLRNRLDEVRQAAAGRPVRILCASGMRSYLAHRVLDQAGFDSATLSGGMATLRASLPGRGAGFFVTEPN